MNADQAEVYEFLKQFPKLYVSVMEVSKRVGNRKNYNHDRGWARPILRRMELEGILESNDTGEYRLKFDENAPPPFLTALDRPGTDLGDTTIIRLEDLEITESVSKVGSARG